MAIQYLTPVNWLEHFIDIFKDDTKYGFNNQKNPDLNVFKEYSVIQTLPETIGSVPALWVACEAFHAREEESIPSSFLHDFIADLDIYLIALRETSIQYNDMTWEIPSMLSPEPGNNLLFLLMEYVGKKLEDNAEIIGTGYWIAPKAFVRGEFYYAGYRAISDGRAVRLGLTVEVEIE